MIHTEQDIEKAVANLVSKNQAPIVRHYDGYIILAQNENDFKTKVSKIQRGDTFGFYTIQRALGLNCT
jgi:transcriptional regulator of NAD metabolism